MKENLTPEQVRAILASRDALSVLAKRNGVTINLIRAVRSGARYTAEYIAYVLKHGLPKTTFVKEKVVVTTRTQVNVPSKKLRPVVAAMGIDIDDEGRPSSLTGEG